MIVKVIEAAKAGDLQACKLVLDRIVPTLRPVDSPEVIQTKGDSLTDLSRAIVQAAVAGKITPSVAKSITQSLATVARIEEISELRQRLEKIEAAYESIHTAKT